MDRIYLDNAATTRVTERVARAMLPFLSQVYGNPSSVHSFGREARRAVEKARRQVAEAIGAQPSDVYFTSGGTESDNWALLGAARALRQRGAHVVTSSIEHHAVLESAAQLEREGFRVTYLPADGEGRIDPARLERAMESGTILVSVMAANNEIGTIEPVAELAKVAHAHGALFHTDAVQAAGSIPIDVEKLGVDMLSLSSHKFHGPKGAGALYVRGSVRLERLIAGGQQERAQRAGTENVPAIVGMGEAIAAAADDMPARTDRIRAMRDALADRLLREIPGCVLNGPARDRLCGNLNVSFPGIEGESLLLLLDMRGIAASSGSACAAGSVDPSHVLLAIGRTREEARGSLRLSLSDENTMEEIGFAADSLKEIVSSLRGLQGPSERDKA